MLSINFDMANYFTNMSGSIVLAAENESFLASLVKYATVIIKDGDQTYLPLVASLHQCGFRACLMLSARYSQLQLEFLSAFFNGNAFQAKSDTLEKQFNELAIDQPLSVLPHLANLRGIMLGIVKRLISPITLERSRKFLSFGTCETLAFGGSGLLSSLPADLPFYKVIELGTLYSSVEHEKGEYDASKRSSQTDELEYSLKFVAYLYTNRPNALILSGPALFSRLLLIFLCPPDIVHSQKLGKLLEILVSISVRETTLVQNVNIPLVGIPSFTDYFMKLCDSYEGRM